MAIISVEPLSTSSNINPAAHRDYVSVFRAISDDPFENPRTVAEDAALPKWGFYYTWNGISDQWSWCQGVNITRDNLQQKRGWWTCTYNYSSRPFNREAFNTAGPLQQPPEYSGNFISRSKAVSEDREGNAIRTAADEPLLAIEIDDYGDSFTVVQNTATINLTTRSSLINKTNDAAYLGFPTATLRLTNWDFHTSYYIDPAGQGVLVPYVENRLEFRIDTVGLHIIQVLNAGMHVRPAPGQEAQPAVIGGEKAVRPVLLAADGTKLPDGDPATYFNAVVYDRGDFTQLPIPGTLPSHIIAT